MKNICLSECGRNYRELQKAPVLTKDFSQSQPRSKWNMPHTGQKHYHFSQLASFTGLQTYNDKCKWWVQPTCTHRGSVEIFESVINFLSTVLKWNEGLILYSWFLFTLRNKRYSKSPSLHFCGDHLKLQKIMQCKIWEALFMWAFGWDPTTSA